MKQILNLKHYTFKLFKLIFQFLPLSDKRIRRESYRGNTSPIAVVIIDTFTMNHEIFHSINKAAISLNSYQRNITRKLFSKQLYNNRYLIITKKEFGYFTFIQRSLAFILYISFIICVSILLYFIINFILSNNEEIYKKINEAFSYTKEKFSQFIALCSAENNSTPSVNLKPEHRSIHLDLDNHDNHRFMRTTQNQNTLNFHTNSFMNYGFAGKAPYSFRDIYTSRNQIYFKTNNKDSILDLANLNFHSILNIANLDFHSMSNTQNAITNKSPITPITPITELIGLYSYQTST